MASHLINESTLPPNPKSYRDTNYTPESEWMERLEMGLRELCKQGKASEEFTLRVASQLFEKRGKSHHAIVEADYQKKDGGGELVRTRFSFAKDGDHISLTIEGKDGVVDHGKFYMPEIERRAEFRDIVERTLEYMRSENISEAESDSYGTFRLEGDVISVTRDGELIAAYKTDDLNTELSAEQVEAHRAEGMSLFDQIDRGYPRPAHVSEDQWTAAERDYLHHMTLENTPDEFVPGTAAYARENYIGSEPIQWTDEEWENIQVAERERVVDVIKTRDDGRLEDDGGVYTLDGDTLTFTHGDGTVSAWKTDNLNTEIAVEQSAATHVSDAVMDEASKAAKPAFDLTNMMASAGLPNSQQSEMIAPTDQAAQPSVPSFMKSRSPDFSTPPTKAPEKAAATATKLTSDSRIVRLDDRGDKWTLASDEAKKQGPEVAIERKAFTVSGKEIVSSFEMTKEGKVVVTDYDGSKAEMSFAQAKRYEIEQLAAMNRNALIALNMMTTDPTFTLRQGNATYSVQNGFFCQKLDNGEFKKEPLSRTQERWTTRIREVEAMLPELDRNRRFAAMADRAASFARVEPKGNATTVEQGMRQ
ncbi:hypothetical protein [Agrobacterium radiobacter]|uniref:hypothetical protein n=1 Tax=Agrobacterium radiobacter TaxID=362 RepID=UPI003CE587CE